MIETSYQACHRCFGGLERMGIATARELLQERGAPKADMVKELRQRTDLPMAVCADMLRCTWRDMRLEQLQAENAKLRAARDTWQANDAALRELVRDFDKCLDTALYLAESAGYPTMPDQKLFASLRQRMRELGIGVDE